MTPSRARIIAVGDPPIFRQQVAQAIDLPAETIVWLPSLTVAEELFSGDQGEPDVLVLSPSVEESDVLGLAQLTSRYSPTTAVVLVRDSADDVGAMFHSYMRAGIRDIVDLSNNKDELADALQRALTWSTNLRAARGEGATSDQDLGRVITVFSSKGGSGKSFFSSNLAVALSRLSGLDTAIVDLDLALGDVFSYFGSEPVRPVSELMTSGAKPDEDTIMTNATKLGETLWGFGAALDPAGANVPAEGVANLVLAMRKTFAYTVIDAPAGYSNTVLPALDHSDTICLVAALDVVGIKHLAKGVETLISIGLPRERLFIVMNRADSKVGLEIADVEKVTKLKIDALVPSSRLVPMSLNKGQPVVIGEPRSDVAKSIESIATRFVSAAEASASRSVAKPLTRFRLRRA